ncbi:MAG: histidine kinase [Candidatus Ruminococcus intestinipullorum]|nr:histidine kinase [Candidatus Ruminococcus intestinipullorum]
MKKGTTLRHRLLMNFMFAALIPVFIFAAISQFNIEKNLKKNLNDRIESNLRNANQSLNMILDKYTTILYDFCADEEVLQCVEAVDQSEDILEINRSILRRKLIHLCNQNTGIEGILIQTAGGKLLFYDRFNASSVHSEWIQEIEVPKIERGEKYSISNPVFINGQRYYFFHIARNLIDYKDIKNPLGTVVISVNEERLKQAFLSDDDSSIYLIDEGKIISASNSGDIGKDLESIQDNLEKSYTMIENESSGLTICNEQNLVAYQKMFIYQWEFLMVVMLITALLTVLFIYYKTKPYLSIVASMGYVMNCVEHGNFKEKISVEESLPIEIQRISYGFNEMIGNIEDLIEQVKKAVLEQKNAELSALEAQIDPHFLYNTLDTINWKAIEKEEYEISEMLGALADILRYTVWNAGGSASIGQEISWLKQYILLQKAKLGKRLDVEILVPKELERYRIHKLLLQPFVENSLKYAFANQEECLLTIQIKKCENQLHILIQDNGIGIDSELLHKLNSQTDILENHLGIANVRKRLKLYYGELAAVYFESEIGNYTKVHLFIPVKEDEEICES